MTIRATPPISLTDVIAELRVTNPGRTYPISLGDTDVRALAGRPSGSISLSDLYGKSGYTPMSIQASGEYKFQDSGVSAGTASASAIATVGGGSGAKSYSWAVLSSTGNPVLSGLTSPTLNASKGFVRYAQGSASVNARCTVTDETGAMVTSPAVDIILEWGDGTV